MNNVTIFDKFGNTHKFVNVVYLLYVSDLKVVITEKKDTRLVNTTMFLKDIESMDVE